MPMININGSQVSGGSRLSQRNDAPASTFFVEVRKQYARMLTKEVVDLALLVVRLQEIEGIANADGFCGCSDFRNEKTQQQLKHGRSHLVRNTICLNIIK